MKRRGRCWRRLNSTETTLMKWNEEDNLQSTGLLFSHNAVIYTDSDEQHARCIHQINNQQPTNQAESWHSQALDTESRTIITNQKW